jgi:hypothetical protein
LKKIVARDNIYSMEMPKISDHLFPWESLPLEFIAPIGHKWESLDCPLPNLSFDETLKMLSLGGSLATFIFEERAVANLVVKAWRDKKFKAITVFCLSQCKTARLRKEIEKSLTLLIPDWKKTVIRNNDEYGELFLEGGLKCTCVNAKRQVRGISECDLIIHMDNVHDNSFALFCKDLPVLKVKVDMDDESTKLRRQKIKRNHEAWVYATLRICKIN